MTLISLDCGSLASLYRYAITNPKRVLVFALLVVLGIAPGALRLRIRTDGHALVPQQAPEIALDRSIRDEFHVEDPIVVLIRTDHEQGIFNTPTLTLVSKLTETFEQIEGVRPEDVFSLATEHGHRVFPGTLTARRFLEPLPTTPQQLQTLRADLRKFQIYSGTLVSRDESATAVMVGIPHRRDRTEAYRKITKIVDALGPQPERIDVIGAPVAEALLGTHILEDLGVPSMVLGQSAGEIAREAPSGLPRSLHELRIFIAGNIGLVPVALLVMALVFFAAFGSVTAVVLPLSEVGAALAFVFGLMGWFDVPVYLTIAVLPVILTAIGVADEIHIFARYRELLRQRPDDEAVSVLRATMAEMSSPITKTSITTCVGFLSFALSPIGPVQAFGVFTAIGVLFCMVWSLTVIPALLAIIPPRRIPIRSTAESDGPVTPISWFGHFGRWVIKLRLPIVLAAVVITWIAPRGVRQVVVQDSWIDGFAPESEFRSATQWFNQQFLGTHLLLIRLDTGDITPLTGEVDARDMDHNEIRIPLSMIEDGTSLVAYKIELQRTEPPLDRLRGRVPPPWKSIVTEVFQKDDQWVIKTTKQHGSPIWGTRLTNGGKARYTIKPLRLTWPPILKHISKFEDFIREHTAEAVGGVIGTAGYMRTTNYILRGLHEEHRRIPDRANQVERAWQQFQRVRGINRRLQVLDENYARSLITVYLKNANFVDTARLMNSIRQYQRDELSKHNISIEFGGDVAVSQTLIGAIVTTQVRSLILSLVGVFLVTSLMARSLAWGFLCVLPCVLAILFNFAAMGWTGMPLGVATSMFSGMTLGIGVDFAIHLLERYRRARRNGLGVDAGLRDAMSVAGPAIFIDAIAVALGFGVLVLSQVPANARLGGLVVLSIGGCFATTLLLLPALIRLFDRE